MPERTRGRGVTVIALPARRYGGVRGTATAAAQAEGNIRERPRSTRAGRVSLRSQRLTDATVELLLPAAQALRDVGHGVADRVRSRHLLGILTDVHRSMDGMCPESLSRDVGPGLGHGQ